MRYRVLFCMLLLSISLLPVHSQTDRNEILLNKAESLLLQGDLFTAMEKIRLDYLAFTQKSERRESLKEKINAGIESLKRNLGFQKSKVASLTEIIERMKVDSVQAREIQVRLEFKLDSVIQALDSLNGKYQKLLAENASLKEDIQRQNLAMDLITKAMRIKVYDPTLSARLMYEASRISEHKNPLARDYLQEIYSNSSTVFYQKNLDGHKGKILSLAYSPDGQSIIAGADDYSVRIFDLEGNEIDRFIDLGGDVKSVAFSPNDQYIAAGTAEPDSRIRVWNLDGKLILDKKANKDGVETISFSPDSKYILTGGKDNRGLLWNITKGNIEVRYEAHTNDITDVAFSPDGEYVLTASVDKTARLWKLNGKEIRIYKNHEEPVTSVAFSPDGQYVLTGSKDRTARLGKVKKKRGKQILRGHNSFITSVSFSPINSELILTTSVDQTVRLWNYQGEEVQSYFGHTSDVHEAVFSPSGEQIASAGGDKSIKIWDLTYQRNIAYQNTFPSQLIKAKYSPNGKYILIGSEDIMSRVWDLSSDNVRIFRGHRAKKIQALASSPDSKKILTGGNDDIAIYRSLETGESIWSKKHPSNVLCADVSLSGNLVLTTASTQLFVWDSLGTSVNKLKIGDSPILEAFFSKDEKAVFFAHKGGEIRRWNLENNSIELIGTNNRDITSMSVSPDEHYLITGSQDSTLALWGIKERNKIQSYKGHLAPITSVDFHPDGKYILSGSEDRTAKIWDVWSGDEIHSITARNGYPCSVEFSPDRQSVMLGIYHLGIELYRLELDILKLMEKDEVIAPLTPAQRKLYGIPEQMIVD